MLPTVQVTERLPILIHYIDLVVYLHNLRIDVETQPLSLFQLRDVAAVCRDYLFIYGSQLLLRFLGFLCDFGLGWCSWFLYFRCDLNLFLGHVD